MKFLSLMCSLLLAGSTSLSWAANVSDKNAAAVRIKDINSKPASYLNKKVSIHGEVQKMLSDRSFILNGEGIINDEIMVIRKAPTKGASPNVAVTEGSKIEEDDELRVIGTVRRMTLADIRREYSLDFDPKIAVEFEGTFPVIIAEDIQITDKD